MSSRLWMSLSLIVIIFAASVLVGPMLLSFADPPAGGKGGPAAAGDLQQSQVVHRSPVDLALLDSRYLVTANQVSNSVSLVDRRSGKVVFELPVGEHPTASVTVKRSTPQVLVSCAYSGAVHLLQREGDRLRELHVFQTGFHPTGLATTGDRAYVALAASGEVAQLDLTACKLVRKISVGKWPRYLALAPTARRLAVGLSGQSTIAVIDTEKAEVLYDEPLSGGINFGHMQCSADGQYAYFPGMVYRSNPIDRRNIRMGWVLASRIGRVRLDGESYREAISLDVPGKAIADPHGLVISPDQRRLVAAASGTHELLVYRLPDLPFICVGGPGDLIDRRLLRDDDMFYRIPVGGRPMGMAMGDNRTVCVANFLRDSVQVVDIQSRRVTQEISLGARPKLTAQRRGMAVFYDGTRSLDQWYSCHSCHYNGGVNSKPMDTMNDGSQLTMKTVLPLYNVHHTSPWTWHGWQTDLQDAMQKSFTTTMQGSRISRQDADDVLAYLQTLKLPPNPFRRPDGTLTTAAKRGQAVFVSRKAGCSSCHSGEYFTDGKIHDVGLGEEEDQYDGFNTPSLLGVYRKVRFLHDGRAKSLEDVLTDEHAPENVTGQGKLSQRELDDLIEYLKSL